MKRMILILVVIVGLMLMVTSCSEEKTTEPEIRQVAKPTIDPPGGAVSEDQRVTINCATEGATIHYTLDGNDPTTSSTIYINPIRIERSLTLKARAVKSGWNNSEIAIAVFTSEEESRQVATPSIDPPGGSYDSPQNVTISCETEGAIIKYSTDGREPTDNSLVYVSPIEIRESTTLIAKAFKDGWNPSQTASAHYTIEIPPPPDMVLVEGGTFNPSANYTVNLSSFYIAKYEVTQSEYQSVMGTNPSSFGGNPNHPVEMVNWSKAVEYCNRLSIREGLTPAYRYSNLGTNPANWPAGWNTSDANHTNISCNWNANGYRLPTEMEREFAARGGVPAQNAGTFNDLWAGTNVEGQLINYAWYSANSNSRTHPVGTKLPNELGLYDMSGNVWNWVWDIRANYPTGVHNNPTGPTTGASRVLRGGSWYYVAYYCRVDIRALSLFATIRLDNRGFRLSRTQN